LTDDVQKRTHMGVQNISFQLVRHDLKGPMYVIQLSYLLIRKLSVPNKVCTGIKLIKLKCTIT